MKAVNKKINYVDILIAVFCAFLIVVFASEIYSGTSRIDFTQKEAVTITLKSNNIPLKHSELIKNGDTVYFAENGEIFGKVKYISYDSENIEFLDKLTNASTIYKSPDKKSCLMLIEADAEIKDNSYLISKINIAESDAVELFTPSYSFEATVVNIQNGKE